MRWRAILVIVAFVAGCGATSSPSSSAALPSGAAASGDVARLRGALCAALDGVRTMVIEQRAAMKADPQGPQKDDLRRVRTIADAVLVTLDDAAGNPAAAPVIKELRTGLRATTLGLQRVADGIDGDRRGYEDATLFFQDANLSWDGASLALESLGSVRCPTLPDPIALPPLAAASPPRPVPTPKATPKATR